MKYMNCQETARSTANQWAARNLIPATNQEVTPSQMSVQFREATRRNWKKNWFY